MKARTKGKLVGLVVLVAGVCLGAEITIEDISPAYRTNMPIVWQAAANHLPAGFWVYRKMPQVFSAAAISNGIVLAGFEKKGFPRPSRRDVVLWAEHMEGEPRPPHFAIYPKHGQMSFTLGDRAPDSPEGIARDEAAVKRALKCATLLGVAPVELAPTNAATAGVYGVFLARQVDGVRFFDGTEGLQIQFGKDGKLRDFGLMWPRLEREQSYTTASASEIIRCIRAREAPLKPGDDEGQGFFARVKGLAGASKLTITSIQPYYSDGAFGEKVPENEESRFVSPVAELEAVAELGTNRVAVEFYAPLLKRDVQRLLGKGR